MFGLDKFLLKKMLAYALRRALTAAGLYLIEQGWVDASDWTQMLPGLSLVLVDFALSMTDKVMARRTVQAAVDPTRSTPKTEKAIAEAMKAA